PSGVSPSLFNTRTEGSLRWVMATTSGAPMTKLPMLLTAKSAYKNSESSLNEVRPYWAAMLEVTSESKAKLTGDAEVKSGGATAPVPATGDVADTWSATSEIRIEVAWSRSLFTRRK